ncbi:class I SAM-dependent methyltransferase [Archangium gephyra]|uniref:class I SAM-dependent methyltransferase n=1 Tax=Archangium gephyra TaxID=48 RepID=UPI0035D3E31F
MNPCDLCGGTDSQFLGITYNVALRSDDHPYELRQCRGCGCIFTDMSRVGVATDYYTDGYYSFRPYGTKRAQDGQVRVERPEKLLDVGCGSGEWLFQQQLQGHEVWGLDADARAVEAARAHGLRAVREFSELPDGYFDWVRLSHVLEHTASPTEMMQAVGRKLTPGGRMEILVPNADGAKFRELMPVSRVTDVPRHLYFFSEATLRRLLRKTGFTVELITHVNVNWVVNLREVVGDTRRLLMHRRKAKEPLPRTLGLLGKILKVHLSPTTRAGVRKDWLYARAHMLADTSDDPGQPGKGGWMQPDSQVW